MWGKNIAGDYIIFERLKTGYAQRNDSKVITLKCNS